MPPFSRKLSSCFFFFFNDTATTEIYTLSLHDALPISAIGAGSCEGADLELLARHGASLIACPQADLRLGDRKSTRLNSSHLVISYAVFCLKKKNRQERGEPHRRHRSRYERSTARNPPV